MRSEPRIPPERGHQLVLAFADEPPPPGTGSLLWTRELRDHPSRPRILKMVRFAIGFFPELEEASIRVGIARGAHGYASLEDPAIWLNPRGLSYQTIAHELVHLLQAKRLVPFGERSCDLYSLARDPLLNDAPPVYVKVPDRMIGETGVLQDGAASRICATAREAIRRRAAGERRYIQWFERTLDRTDP